jgi:hypothetical protein
VISISGSSGTAQKNLAVYLVRQMILRLLPVALLGAMLAFAAPASARTVTETFRVGPIEVDGYEVKVENLRAGIPKPAVNAHITKMEADLVDGQGRLVPIQRLMLHHIVFLKLGVRDATCHSFTGFDDMTVVPNLAERFYAAGEERAIMALPRGYGYPTSPGERWGMTTMVMNHRAKTDRAYVRYKVTYDTDPAVKPVKPIWMDVENCRSDPVYDVPGGRKPGSVHRRSTTWTAPEGGRIVGGGGHVHGGAKGLRLSQPACGDRTLLESRPLWGNPDHPFYRVKPVLHEPGPVSMSGSLSAQGWPLARGERVKLTSTYDAELPHTRVMGILVHYFAPDPTVTDRCGAQPTDVATGQMRPQPGRARTPKVVVPLTGLNARGRAVHINRPPGKLHQGKRRNRIRVIDFAFAKRNLRVPRGARVRWDFRPATLHNVTLASGPRGFSSPNLSAGRSYRTTLKRRGTYKLFCGLHPVSMTQRIVVR